FSFSAGPESFFCWPGGGGASLFCAPPDAGGSTLGGSSWPRATTGDSAPRSITMRASSTTARAPEALRRQCLEPVEVTVWRLLYGSRPRNERNFTSLMIHRLGKCSILGSRGT